MLARSRTVTLPSGKSLTTPLLVPSFSSRGFAIDKDTGLSEASRDLALAAEHLYSAMLISAYDLHHGHLGKPDDYLSVPEILIIDSGGYELGLEPDLSTVYTRDVTPATWSPADLGSVLASIREKRLGPVAIVSPDFETLHKPLAEQLGSAREFFAEWPTFLADLLLKPTTKEQQYLPVDEIRGSCASLRGISILGFTESELGNSVLDRLRSIARIRLSLDEADVTAAIHVFGSLDPLLTPLYFLAGAEIFDGLSWLRYGYHDGLAIYYQHYGALIAGPQRRRDQARAQMLVDNLTTLEKLGVQMTTFLEAGDFAVFGPQGEHLKAWYSQLCAKVKGVR